jgi:hypothetical protein
MKQSILVLLLMLTSASAAERPAQPVVIELFTSQGCSSCPPADELLATIVRDPKLRASVIPLAFHVDYWNSLGWRDPFSAREWSARQGDYVRALKLSSAYTPQIVVNGTKQFVGSDRNQLFRAIAEESKRPAAGAVSVTLAGTTATVRAQSPAANVDVVVIEYQNAASTRVTRGENNGRTLTNQAVVWKLSRVATLDGKTPVTKQVAVDGRYGVVAFCRTARRGGS